MSGLDTARNAMVHAQEAISGFGSNNKLTTLGREMSPDEVGQKIMRDTKIAALQSTAPSRGTNMSAIVAHGRAAAKKGAGNCMELTAIACAYLEQQGGVSFDAVQLAPGDHIFAVVDQSGPNAAGEYPADMASWDGFICDAWVGVACRARDFPAEWKQKMREWSARGVELMIDASATRGPGTYDRVKADHTFWLNALDPDKKKLSFTHIVKKKKKCLLATAACEALGLPDDCADLQTLRRYRDHVVLASRSGVADVERYYRLAPGAIEQIRESENAARVFADIYTRVVRPAVAAIDRGDHAVADSVFRDVLRELSNGVFGGRAPRD